MSRPRVLLATRSADKLREIQAILGATTFDLVSLADAGIPASDEEEAIEAFESFRENALAKAAHFLQLSGLPSLADDSGLAVDALGGAPGVRSKRFSQRPDLTGKALDAANNELLLERLAATTPERRSARYVCAAVLALPGGGALGSIGTCEGHILEVPRGPGGFGYDPLFAPAVSDRSFAEWPPAGKNRISHRARAFRALAAPAAETLRALRP